MPTLRKPRRVGHPATCAANKYTYDAEGRIITAQMNGGGTATYQYDGEGRRVRKQSGATIVDYLHDLSGRTILEINSATTWTRGEAFTPDGRHIATYSGGPTGTTYFHHSDWLGTERSHTNVGGTTAWTCTSEPFGDGASCTGAEPTPDFFTGKERDSESGLDMFGARYYGSSLGRFMTPDWAAKPTSVPYAEFGNPQSLNLYSYVGNNPLSKADPDGHDALWIVDKQTGKVTLVIPVHITGNGVGQKTASTIVNRDNTLNTNGSSVKIQVIETDKPINGVLNKMDVSSGYDQNKYPGAGEGTNKLGGNEAHINSDNGQATDAAAHDILHFAGIKDQYQEGPRDAQGNRTSTPTPGYDNSNIMTSRSGTNLKPEQIQEAQKNQTTKQCTSDNGKTVCK